MEVVSPASNGEIEKFSGAPIAAGGVDSPLENGAAQKGAGVVSRDRKVKEMDTIRDTRC